MIDPENFHHLLEISHLNLKYLGHQKNIEDQNKRVSQVELQRQRASEERDSLMEKAKNLRQLMVEQENELAKTQTQFERNLETAQMVTSEAQLKANETEKETLRQKLLSLEEQVFELMEQVEELEEKIKDKESFLEGSKKAITEIQADVEANTKVEQKNADNFKKRIDGLLETVTPKMSQQIQRILQKMKDPFAKVKAGHCGTCGMGVDKFTQDEVELLQDLVTCGSCGRIFLPSSIKE